MASTTIHYLQRLVVCRASLGSESCRWALVSSSNLAPLPFWDPVMNCSARIWGIALLWSTTGWPAASTTQAFPITVQLKSADTALVFEASMTAPRLVTLQHAGELPWTNRTPETLIDSAEVSGQPGPLHWQFNREASQTDGERVAFVYDSAAPKLRLTWEWRKRAAQGPIEHSIHIENLDSQEIWLPL
jgi:hypothetical protein